MGKIIARVQTRQAYAALRRAGYSLRSYGPGLPVPPEIERLWGVSTAELRQPEEKAKNEAMRQRLEEILLPPGESPYVDIKPTPQPPAKIAELAAEHQLWPKATSPIAHHFTSSAPFRAAILAYTQAVAEECAKLAEDRGAALRLIGGRAHPDQAGATAIRALFGVADEWLLDRPEGFPPPMSKQP